MSFFTLGTSLFIVVLVRAAFGTACALIAQSRGRSPIGWFFVGFFVACIGLILVLVLPDLKVQQERERHLADENRRLRERLRKDRMVADERHAEIARRVGAHDVALGVDTSQPAAQALPGHDAPPPASDPAGVRSSQWYWAQGLDRRGPVEFRALQALWRDGRVTAQTLVWCTGMPKWIAVREVASLEDALDA
jgi:hypothetical protein